MQRMLRAFLVFIVMVIKLSGQAGNYYNSINTNSSTFVNDLSSRIRNPYTQVSYSQFANTNVNNFASFDNGDGTRSLYCVYSNYQYIYTPPFAWGVMSREHTYCHSWQPGYPSTSLPEYSDQFHLFPTQQNNANGIRSNHPLGKVVTVTSTFGEAKYGKDINNNNVYEPRDKHKGDAARALLYMAIRYNGVNGYDWTFNWLNNTRLPSLGEGPQSLATLIEWHKQDPPDKWEIDRNNYVQSIQQNRNPLVDHPEYVNYINFNDLTKLSPVYSIEPQNYLTNLSANLINSNIKITWTDAAAGTQVPSGYLIEIFNKDNYFLPIDGESYADDFDLSDGRAVINVLYSDPDSLNISNFINNSTYYISAFSYNGNNNLRNYKISEDFPRTVISASANLAPEPSNYLTNFSSNSVTNSSLSLAWDDALPGTQLPEGYLLLANTSGNFSSPVDGISYSNDLDLSDGQAIVNILYSDPNSFNFNGLTPNTLYYFRMYSYNGSGGSRNYKTDGNVPAISVRIIGSNVLPNAWINELHYDNVSTDVNEFIEVVLPNQYTVSTELSKFSVVLYNGSGGASYNTKTLNQFTKGTVDSSNGYTVFYYTYPTDGIQNGSPDGVALGYNDSLIQFLSYEGTFTAVGGIANGVLSTDIGVEETSSTPVGSSLGLSGVGNKYSDFTWTVFNSSATPGTFNVGQLFPQRTLNLTVLIEGLYNGSTSVQDTIVCELRNALNPEIVIQTKPSIISASGNTTIAFSEAVNSTPYYIVVKHRNAIETWSAMPVMFVSNNLNYDFTLDNSKAYGNNLKLKNGKYCIFSGDVNQDGYIEINDLTLVFNNAVLGESGYKITDLNGDLIVNTADMNIVFENSVIGVQAITPLNE